MHKCFALKKEARKIIIYVTFFYFNHQYFSFERSVREKLMFGDPNGFLCVFVGRVSREKRLDVVIDALRGLPGVYLAIIGKFLSCFLPIAVSLTRI
jgi:hypothetical protein